MLISIDHGNKQIKTNHRTFVSGLRESDTKPPFGKDVLFYKGKYYTLTDQRIPYMRDKTADERYFILTLFAVAFELAGTEYRKDEIVDVQLAVGLPPAHYGAQYERFENYFLNRDIIDFQLDGRPYSVFISTAICFPQAYAAIMPIYQRIHSYSIFLFPCLHVWRIRLYEGLRLRKAFFHRIRPTQICVRTCPQRIEAFFRIRRIGP